MTIHPKKDIIMISKNKKKRKRTENFFVFSEYWMQRTQRYGPRQLLNIPEEDYKNHELAITIQDLFINVAKAQREAGTPSLEDKAVLQYAPLDWRQWDSDHNAFIKMVLEADGYNLPYVIDEKMQFVKQYAEIAVKSEGDAIRFVKDDDCLNDANFLGQAWLTLHTKGSGKAHEVYEYAGEALRRNHEAMVEAVVRDPEIFQYVSKDLLSEEAWLGEVIIEYHTLRDEFPEYLAAELDIDEDFKIMSELQDIDPEYLQYAGEDLRNNIDFVKKALNTDRYCLRLLSQCCDGSNLLSDKDFMMYAIEKAGCHTMQYADDSLKNDREFVHAAMEIDPFVWEHVGSELRKDFNQPMQFSH